jgi:nucleoside-diphosphate-sugar epimerase
VQPERWVASLVPKLAARDHELFGMTRRESKREHLRSMGATPVVADALDPDAVATAVAESDPEVIVHQLTALSSSIDMRHLDRDLELTNRLRTDGTDHLLAAGRAIGIKRFVARASPAAPSHGAADGSSPRTIRSIPRRLMGCAALSRPFATWRRR